jgi:hypothetical protein
LYKCRVPSENVKHCLDFSFVFSAPLLAWRNLFSASGIFCDLRYQSGCAGFFWPVEGTSQPVTNFFKWKNLSSALHRKRTWVQAPFCDFRHVPLAYWRQSGTDLKSLRPFSYTYNPHQCELSLKDGHPMQRSKMVMCEWIKKQNKWGPINKLWIHLKKLWDLCMCKLIREHKETSTNRERIWENFGDLIGNIVIIYIYNIVFHKVRCSANF